MTVRPAEIPIGALSRRSGVHVETIRYYERIGLLPAPGRSAGGHRLYRADHVKRLFFIRRARELGFPLDDIRALLGLVDGGDYTCAEVKALTLSHAEQVRAKIADLKKLERALSDVAARCTGDAVPDCPIIETLLEERG